VRAPGKQRVGSIFEFERANPRNAPVLQSSSLPAAGDSILQLSREENRRKKKQQINRDKIARLTRIMGRAGSPSWLRARDVISPLDCRDPPSQQRIALPGFAALLEKRQRATYKRAC